MKKNVQIVSFETLGMGRVLHPRIRHMQQPYQRPNPTGPPEGTIAHISPGKGENVSSVYSCET